ncbi:MAG: RES domain-containing protein, partial [Acidobacteriota bacterium]|nr:RES domain-containing protein [Acidobacteriota bacterium]
MRLYRVFPRLESADSRQPGHPMYVPPMQGRGRVDNPEHYRVLYASDAPIGAIAEAFRNHAVWTVDLFRSPALPDASLALATYDARRASFLDLDDAQTLLDRELRPSDVVTRDRDRTQRWSLAV